MKCSSCGGQEPKQLYNHYTKNNNKKKKSKKKKKKQQQKKEQQHWNYLPPNNCLFLFQMSLWFKWGIMTSLPRSSSNNLLVKLWSSGHHAEWIHHVLLHVRQIWHSTNILNHSFNERPPECRVMILWPYKHGIILLYGHN